MRWFAITPLVCPPKSNHLLTGVLILCSALLGADNKTAGKKSPPREAQPAAAPSGLIWPLPPDPPRIRWVAQYTDMAKVKQPVVRKAGWLDKLTGDQGAGRET